jgi:uncharacterized Zn finger protein
MTTLELHTDGNAIAGLLQEIFATEMTAAIRTCETCGQRRAIGAHRLFHGAGLVLRCPACGDVAATIAVHGDVHVIKLRGVWRMTGDG